MVLRGILGYCFTTSHSACYTRLESPQATRNVQVKIGHMLLQFLEWVNFRRCVVFRIICYTCLFFYVDFYFTMSQQGAFQQLFLPVLHWPLPQQFLMLAGRQQELTTARNTTHTLLRKGPLPLSITKYILCPITHAFWLWRLKKKERFAYFVFPTWTLGLHKICAADDLHSPSWKSPCCWLLDMHVACKQILHSGLLSEHSRVVLLCFKYR